MEFTPTNKHGRCLLPPILDFLYVDYIYMLIHIIKKSLITSCAFLLIGTLLSNTVYAETTTDEQPTTAPQINRNIQDLKNKILELNKDLFVLEEELLFSANTQVNVFLSMDAGKLFNLDSVQLKIDDKIVSNYLYTERELNALNRGGVQGLYTGNMSAGEHEITAIMTGIGPNQQDYKRGVSQKINKTDEALYIEIKILDNTSKEQPDFELKVWE